MIDAVVFDVGETLIDETREYGTWADCNRSLPRPSGSLAAPQRDRYSTDDDKQSPLTSKIASPLAALTNAPAQVGTCECWNAPACSVESVRAMVGRVRVERVGDAEQIPASHAERLPDQLAL